MLTLAELFELQSTFNKRVGLNDGAFQALFLNGEIAENGSKEYNDALVRAGQWIDDMLKAMNSEMEELRNCTCWKHWCSEAQSGQRYRVKDVAAARKEVIDLLHFWISLAQILGMSPDMVSDMYAAKLAKNIKRQDDGYSVEVKDLAWRLRLDHPTLCPVPYPVEATSLEDIPEAAAKHYLDWAKKQLDSHRDTETRELALHLWRHYPDDNPMGYTGLPECLEDMPDDVAEYYLDRALKEIVNRTDCGESIITDCMDAGKRCMYCVEKNCRVRKYLTTLENKDES